MGGQERHMTAYNDGADGVQTIMSHKKLRMLWLAAITGCLLLIAPVSRGAQELKSYAIVHDDATLEVAGRRLRLYGIFIPDTERVCEHRIRPVRCGSRAVQALRFKVQGFVSCRLGGKFDDGSIAAYCRVDEQDLGEYLIGRGWAVARPEAPFAYQVSERIARHRGFGVWGFRVDRAVAEP
jgi:endonuclease YncB( thermonuclease family)